MQIDRIGRIADRTQHGALARIGIRQHRQGLITVRGDHDVIVAVVPPMTVMDHDAMRRPLDRSHGAAEPDLVVVPGHPGDYRASHPAHPTLVVEVAESSLDFDRTRKGSLYARAAVPDYWVVNLVDGVVEVYRDPEPDPSAAFGWRYRPGTRLAPPATVAPLGFSGERVAVADLLP